MVGCNVAANEKDNVFRDHQFCHRQFLPPIPTDTYQTSANNFPITNLSSLLTHFSTIKPEKRIKRLQTGPLTERLNSVLSCGRARLPFEVSSLLNPDAANPHVHSQLDRRCLCACIFFVFVITLYVRRPFEVSYPLSTAPANEERARPAAERA